MTTDDHLYKLVQIQKKQIELAYVNGLRVGLAYGRSRSPLDLQALRDYAETDVHRIGKEYATLSGSPYNITDIANLPDPDDLVEWMKEAES